MKNLTLIQQKIETENSRPQPTEQEMAKARELNEKFAKIERDIKDALTFTRKTKREIAQTIASVLQLKKAPAAHYENGKTASDMEIYDDSYFFGCKTPGYPGLETDVFVYFLKTNEKGILFISEVSVIFGD